VGLQDFGAMGMPSGARRLWWAVFGLLVLAGTAWAVALPPMTGPDEAANAVRASAVARGQWTGGHLPDLLDDPMWANVMVEVEVPVWLAESSEVGNCYTGLPRELFFGAAEPRPRDDDCPRLGGDDDLVATRTYEYRGPPAYYLLVGLPTRVASGDTGALAMRVVGLLLCSALLASAVLSLRRLSPRARALAALGATVAVTPEVLYLAATQNAAGLEVAASLGLWAAGLALAVGPAEPDGRLVHRAGVALVVLVLTRGLSPGFAALALLALLVVARPGRARALLRRTDVRVWAGVTGLAVLFAAAWLRHIHDEFPLYGYPPTGFAAAWDRVPWWAQGMVAVFGSTDVVPPAGLHVAWVLSAGAVLGLAAWAGSRRPALLAAGLVVVGVGLLISGEGFGVPQTGFWWQGRYVLPCIVGALLLAGAGARERPTTSNATAATGPAAGTDDPAGTPAARPDAVDRVLGRAGLVLAALFVVGQVWAFGYALRHYTVGHEGPANPASFLFDPAWSPPLPPALLLALFAAAVAGLALALHRVGFGDDPGVPTAERDGPGPVAREDGDEVEYGRPHVMAGKAG
jgi:hypothetical protein